MRRECADAMRKPTKHTCDFTRMLTCSMLPTSGFVSSASAIAPIQISVLRRAKQKECRFAVAAIR